MAVNIDDLLPSAKEFQKQAALKEAEKADQHAERLAAAEAEKRSDKGHYNDQMLRGMKFVAARY
jgi:hypothetical protein